MCSLISSTKENQSLFHLSSEKSLYLQLCVSQAQLRLKAEMLGLKVSAH